MSTLIVMLSLLTAPPTQDAVVAATSPSATEVPIRTRAEWVADVRDALRGQATAEDIDQPVAFVRLISLYQQLQQDTTLHVSERNRMRLKVRNRLIRLVGEFQQDLRIRRTKVETVRRRAKIENRPDKLKLIEQDEAVLARWDDMLGQVGGFAQNGGGGGQGNALDHGEELVELIQTVISPDVWEVNGGPMSVVYYQNLRVLVVSATTEIHEQVGGLNDAMRRAGN